MRRKHSRHRLVYFIALLRHLAGAGLVPARRRRLAPVTAGSASKQVEVFARNSYGWIQIANDYRRQTAPGGQGQALPFVQGCDAR
jgi:hypothetical protein